MAARSDVQAGLDEQRRRPDWPTERYLIVRFAVQVAQQLEQERERQGLSYGELAKRAGTSKAHVIRLLGGTYKGISNQSLAKLCHALRCDIDLQIQPVPPVRAAITRSAPMRAERPVAAATLARTSRSAVG